LLSNLKTCDSIIEQIMKNIRYYIILNWIRGWFRGYGHKFIIDPIVIDGKIQLTQCNLAYIPGKIRIRCMQCGMIPNIPVAEFDISMHRYSLSPSRLRRILLEITQRPVRYAYKNNSMLYCNNVIIQEIHNS
jgi:hypothetical protein